MSRPLKDLYLKDIWQKAPWRAPRILQVNLNMGIGRFKDDKAFAQETEAELAQISGQKPKVTGARKSISNFKLREGEPVGLTVTLRGDRMWSFLDKLVNIALPRIRDFRGISPKAFDNHGNYSLGLNEHAVFIEIDANKITKIKGLQVTIVTDCKTDEVARDFLTKLGMPFMKGKRERSQGSLPILARRKIGRKLWLKNA